MAKAKKVLSTVLVALFTVFTVLSYVPAQTTKAAAGPKVQIVAQPNAEYKVGDRVLVKFNSPNYKGIVQYRAFLWNRTTQKFVQEIYKDYPGFWYKPVCVGTSVFTIDVFYPQEPGTYYIGILVKAKGAKTYSSYVYTSTFTVKAKEEATIKEFAPVADVTVDEGATATLPATVKAVMTDGTEKEVAVTWPTVDTTKVGTVKVEGTVAGTTLKPAVNVTVKAVALTIKSVSQVGVKKIAVTFNKKADDQTIALKRGNVTVSVKAITWNEDKTVATIETVSTLLEDTYTVAVGTVTGTVEAKAQKINKIEIKSTDAILDFGSLQSAKVKYAVYNQFGEDITSDTSRNALTWTVTSSGKTDDGKGTLTLTNTTDWEADKSTVVVTAVDTATGTATSAVVTIKSASSVKTFKLNAVKNVVGDDKDQLLNQGDANAADKYDWRITYEAADQYGNAVTSYSYLNTNVILNVSSSASSNKTTVAWAQDPKDNTKAIIKVTPGGGSADETVVVTAVDKTTGANSTLTFKVEKDAGVKTFTMSAPSDLVVAGETVKIPFEAIDQYGNAVTSYSKLKGVVTVTSTNASTQPDFVEDPITKAVTLQFVPAAKGACVITSMVGTDVKTITINANDVAVPTVIEKVSADAILKLTNGASVDLDKDSFVVKDQYNRAIDVKGNYAIVVTEDDNTNTNVTHSLQNITSSSGKCTFTGTANVGSKTYTAVLKDTAASKVVSGSELQFTVQTVDKKDIKEYKVADINKLYAPNTAYDVTKAEYAADIEVYGYLADGSKVALSKVNDIQAINKVGKIAFDNDANPAKVMGIDSDTSKDDSDATGTILVAINTPNGVITIKKDVTVSDDAPVAASIAITEPSTSLLVAGEKFDADNKVVALKVATVTANKTASVYENAATKTPVYFVVKDQYGATYMNPSFYYISEDDVANAGTYKIGNTTGILNIDDTKVTAGDVFTITAVTDNGLSVSLKVIVK